MDMDKYDRYICINTDDGDRMTSKRFEFYYYFLIIIFKHETSVSTFYHIFIQ